MGSKMFKLPWGGGGLRWCVAECDNVRLCALSERSSKHNPNKMPDSCEKKRTDVMNNEGGKDVGRQTGDHHQWPATTQDHYRCLPSTQDHHRRPPSTRPNDAFVNLNESLIGSQGLLQPPGIFMNKDKKISQDFPFALMIAFCPSVTLPRPR